MTTPNLFSGIPASLPDELLETLARGHGQLRIERIVSRGHASPPGFWYGGETAEFVALLKGSAVLRFEDQAELIALGPGDWLEIAKGRRHRVEATDPATDTVWLAVHWGDWRPPTA